MKTILTGALLLTFLTFINQGVYSQKSDAWKTLYRATPERINDLVNTKLEVSFDFEKSWMYGKAWITLHPHFYPTDSLSLDAKRMQINEVSIVKDGKNFPLKYSYDSLILKINLGKTYRGGENYTLFIDYISKPNEIKAKGSMAISSAKGLYFINPTGKDKNKPTQIWTQGETESNSAWCPTIDKPNQKTTDEISMTVPDRFQTLSNGLLVKQKKNKDGTRTDTWKMDLPHAPYLMMMVIGEYSITKDKYKNKEVSYYVEKEYAPVARKIFGDTPEMIALYSRLLGVDYPWQKYAQITARDYVSGAMENTTATLHGDFAQQDARQLVDENSWETGICHELFHQWFGDYVTTESWSNLTINESFADFSELLWVEYKHGKDAADEHNLFATQNYLFSNSSKKDLVRFYYSDKEDMFDAVSYQKGGRILNMLRNYVGDSAFFKSLNLFLTTYKFQAAEAQELRLIFEEVTGKDLNWFWNQWYYESGHPKLDISYGYDQTSKTAKVFVKQTQPDKIFRLPVAVDVYQGGTKKRYKVWLEHQADTLFFPSASIPDLINVDGDKVLLCEKDDHKTLDNYIFQYKNAGLYLDRREAIDFAALKMREDPKAADLLKGALNDRFEGLRTYAIQRLSSANESIRKEIEPKIAEIVKNDPVRLVKASAIQALGRYKNPAWKELFLKETYDSSYSVSGSALNALAAIDTAAAYSRAKALAAAPAKGILSSAINSIVYSYAGENDFDSLASRFESLPWGNTKFQMLVPFSNYVKKIKNDATFRKGVDLLVKFRDSLAEQNAGQMQSYVNGVILNGIIIAKQSSGMADQAEYVKSKIAKEKAPEVAGLTPEILKSYTGEYQYEEAAFKITLSENKTLFMNIADQPAFELTPQTKTKFSIKLMSDYTIEFNLNDKNEAVSMTLKTPGEEIKAERKK